MIYCFDVDGTLTERPDIFGPMMKALIDAGHTVYPLTGMTYATTPFPPDECTPWREAQLESLGIKRGRDYTEVVVVCGNTVQECGELKGDFCKEKKVNFMVEDTGIYADSIKKHSPETLCLRMPNGLQ